MWNEFKRKLSSRKFWMAVVGFVTALLIALKCQEDSVTQVTAVISAFGSLIAYVFAEGYADGNHVDVPKDEEDEEK